MLAYEWEKNRNSSYFKVLIVSTESVNANKTRCDIYNVDTDSYERTNNTNFPRQVSSLKKGAQARVQTWNLMAYIDFLSLKQHLIPLG